MASLSLVIIDRDRERSEMLRAGLGTHGDLEVIASVTMKDAALKRLQGIPAAVLLDTGVLKGRSADRFLRSVQACSAGSRVLLRYGRLPDDDVLLASIKAGARGYLLADDPPAIVAKAVRAVMSGEIWAARRVLAKALDRPMLLPAALHAHTPGLPSLTCRELEMLNQVMRGATNREIAVCSSISEQTVKTHLYRIYKKLNVKSRTKAIALLSNA